MSMTMAGQLTERFQEMVKRSFKYMGPEVAAQVKAMLTPASIAILAGTLALWAGSHAFGWGFVVDVALLIVAWGTVGFVAFQAAKQLAVAIQKTVAAASNTDPQLEEAARAFAQFVTLGGIGVISALLLRRPTAAVRNAAFDGSVDATQIAVLDKMGLKLDTPLYRGAKASQAQYIQRAPVGRGGKMKLNPESMGTLVDEFNAYAEHQFSFYGEVPHCISPGDINLPSLNFSSARNLALNYAEPGRNLAVTTVRDVLRQGYRIVPDVAAVAPNVRPGWGAGAVGGVFVIPGPSMAGAVPPLKVKLLPVK